MIPDHQDNLPQASCRWRWHHWRELDPDTIYAFLKLRSDIFVVEQNCAFSDMDGLDPHCEHLCGSGESGQLFAYLRLLPPGAKSAEPALGRLVVAAAARGSGLARAAMREGILRCRARYPDQAIFLSAQKHLAGFYASLGFATIGAAYLEDGIPHVDMRWHGPRAA